jgi:hypothetical protein
MKKFHGFLMMTALVAAIAIGFAGCEQTLTQPLTGENAVAFNKAAVVQKPQVPPSAWQSFSPVPFASMTDVQSVNGLATDGTTLVAAAYDGDRNPFVTHYDTLSGQWSAPLSIPFNMGTGRPNAHYLNGFFLVTGASGAVNGAYSPDGTKWAQTGTIGFGTKAAVYGPRDQIYVVAGQNGQAAYTSNLGSGFVTIPGSVTGWDGTGPNFYINAGAYGAGNYVFGGGGGQIAYTPVISATARWSQVGSPFLGQGFVDAIAFGGDDVFVAVGDATGGGGIIAFSDNGGRDWRPADTSAAPLVINDGIFALTYDSGCFTAVNDSGYAAYSHDGMVWTDSPSSVTGASRVDAVVYYAARGTFFAVGGYPNDTVYIVESN